MVYVPLYLLARRFIFLLILQVFSPLRHTPTSNHRTQPAASAFDLSCRRAVSDAGCASAARLNHTAAAPWPIGPGPTCVKWQWTPRRHVPFFQYQHSPGGRGREEEDLRAHPTVGASAGKLTSTANPLGPSPIGSVTSSVTSVSGSASTDSATLVFQATLVPS